MMESVLLNHPITSGCTIIGLAGVAGSGKDTAAKYLELRGFTRLAFADAVKDAVDSIEARELLKHDLARGCWQEMGDVILAVIILGILSIVTEIFVAKDYLRYWRRKGIGR